MKTTQTLKIACLLCAMALQAVTSGGQTVTNVAAGGNYFSLFLKSDGSLWAMGDNSYGQLGDGSTDGDNYYTNLPEQIVAGNVTTISAGGYHSLFLKSDGSLWAMGDNSYGQLGDGINTELFNNNNATNLPERIVAGNVTAISAGGYHSLFLKSDGSLWAMGFSSDGQLGDGSSVYSGYYYTNRPEQIVAGNVTAIAAGGYHSLFLKSDGSLWAMGYNQSGQLGDGTYNNTNQPEQIVAGNVTAIAAGLNHSLFLKSNGSLWAMGANADGELGDGTYNGANQPEQIVAGNVIAISAGWTYSLFLKSDGSLWAMGANWGGQLGDGTYNDTNRPEQIVAGSVTAISAGWFHSLFLKSGGSLWAIGDNSYGELGDGTYNATDLPEQIPVANNPISGWLSGQLLETGDIQLSFVGIARANYALERSFNLASSDWAPQVTNPADAGGVLVFTNTPNKSTNNFWRLRVVP